MVQPKKVHKKEEWDNVKKWGMLSYIKQKVAKDYLPKAAILLITFVVFEIIFNQKFALDISLERLSYYLPLYLISAILIGGMASYVEWVLYEELENEIDRQTIWKIKTKFILVDGLVNIGFFYFILSFLNGQSIKASIIGGTIVGIVGGFGNWRRVEQFFLWEWVYNK